MTNICVLGSGGREYAIIKSLIKNKKHNIFCYSDKDNYFLIQLCNLHKGPRISPISTSFARNII